MSIANPYADLDDRRLAALVADIESRIAEAPPLSIDGRRLDDERHAALRECERRFLEANKRDADADRPERLPTLVYVWRGPLGGLSFESCPGYARRVIEVPVGWSMVSVPDYGTVLQDVWGNVSTVGSTWEFARNRIDGFRFAGEPEATRTATKESQT